MMTDMQKVTDKLEYEIKIAYSMLSEINDAVCNADTIDDLAVLGLKAHSMKKLWTQYTASFLVEHGIYDSVRHLLLTIDDVIETIIDPKVDRLRVSIARETSLRVSLTESERPPATCEIHMWNTPFIWQDEYDDRSTSHMIGVVESESLDDHDELLRTIYGQACERSTIEGQVIPLRLDIFVPSRIYVLTVDVI